jgi:hypothetical protein
MKLNLFIDSEFTNYLVKMHGIALSKFKYFSILFYIFISFSRNKIFIY